MGLTINRFKSREEFYNAVVEALNKMYPDKPFKLRWNEATTAQELSKGIRRYVEPGEWGLARSTRGTSKRSESVRLIIEGVIFNDQDAKTLISDAAEFLDEIGTRMIRNPQEVDGAFCVNAQAFSDAAPLYDPSAANEQTPLLYAGLTLQFWWIA